MSYFKYFGLHDLQVYAVGDSVTGPMTKDEAHSITDRHFAKYYVYVLTKASTQEKIAT